ncbi:hypothetical protein M3Y97_00548300 [Aphelenchoides bicaudatus]|nr:hypothetical protein M3Y97_00548300 [Aphelenchoides bicaudatus]
MPSGRFMSSLDEMDANLLKHLQPYQMILYNNSYSPSTVSFEEQSSTATNDASSLLSSLGSSSARTYNGSGRLRPQLGTENFWLRRLNMNGQLGANSSIPKMKNFWETTAEKERLEAEKCMQMHKLQRPYDFPRWRSSDAMSASLVASSQTNKLIPTDSRMPQHRINKIHENETEAQKTKQLIHQQNAASRPARRTNFNTSMCLSPEDFEKQQSWYDRDLIRSSIENPSIANMRETRSYFEQASQAKDFENQLIPRPFVSDRTVLSPVPLNQALSVQCQQQQNFVPSPHVSPNSNIHQNQYNNSQNVYSQPQNDTGFVDYQEPIVESGRQLTFLEREVLQVAQREREFQEQQKRNGHMTLEDTFELWRNGNTWDAVMSRPNSLNEFQDFDSGVENMTTSSTNN